MKKLLTLLVVFFPLVARAHGPHVQGTVSAPPRPLKNAQVIDAASTAEIKKGMKRFASGLGVKCERCHDEDDYGADSLKTKLAARRFLNATIEAPPASARDRALAELKLALGLTKLEDEDDIWSAVESWKRRRQP